VIRQYEGVFVMPTGPTEGFKWRGKMYPIYIWRTPWQVISWCAIING